jgi:uncharacterized repeat protein (TIGR03803 family)
MEMLSARPDVHKYKVLYSFGGEPGGQTPVAMNIFDGSLYGTTSAGGSAGEGSVFQSSLSGKARVVYSFQGGQDGSLPYSGLTEFRGSFYGVTYFGGGDGCLGTGCGTVYAIDSSGKERVVYRFKPNKVDGRFPSTSLVSINGVLYGATSEGYEPRCGGNDGCGRIFSIDAAGKERIIYRFKGGADGCWPSALVALKGTLYGVTQGGGTSYSSCAADSPGTVFAVMPSGKETVLYRFKGIPDGAVPNSLMAANGVLYGTTTFGGAQSCEGGNRPCGVVFSVTTSGHEKVLHAFGGYTDGGGPNGLVWLNGQLYGTTCCDGFTGDYGWGTIFGLTRSGVKSTLYRFKGSPDGQGPVGLTVVSGLLYGITNAGGTGSCRSSPGCGTIYRITP